MLVPDHKIILASKSPRRQELLKLMGLDFTVEVKDTDENYPEGLQPAEIVLYIAEKKAKAFSVATGECFITADTIVTLNNDILEKPDDKIHAQEMLHRLSGTTHQVFTGVTLLSANKMTSFYDQTSVKFRAVSSAEIDFYIDNFKPFDKAGSYGIQDWWGLAVVESISGSYTNVMGLPTEKLYNALSIF